MTILSLQLGHNSTAALLIDGEIKGVISEEKFDNIKNSSAFPENSIKWLLNEFNVKRVDYIAMSGLKIYPSQMEVFKDSVSNKKKFSLLMSVTIGLALHAKTAFASATNVKSGIITSSSFLIPNAFNDKCNAAVQFETATAYFAFVYLQKSVSNFSN